MKRKLIVLSAAVIAVMICSNANAASVANAGASLDNAGDLDATSAGLGQGVAGTIFWDYTAPAPQSSGVLADVVGQQRNNLPGYVTFGNGADLVGASGGWGYQQVVDDFGGPFETGTLVGAAGAGPELATLTIGAGSPSALKLGVYLDNLDSTAFIGNDLTVAIGASSASVDPSVNANQTGDIYWYDLEGLVSGDVISIQTSGATNFPSVSGFIVAAIPEPTSIVLLGLAMGSLTITRRRRA